MEFDQERVVQPLQHTSLTHDRLDFSVVDELLLLQHFDGVKAPGVDLSCEHDLAKAASADDSDLLKVVYSHFALLGRLYFHSGRTIQF